VDVTYTPLPGHVAGYGALVNRVGRGFPRAIACGREFSAVATFPYEGPDLQVATKLMEGQDPRAGGGADAAEAAGGRRVGQQQQEDQDADVDG
jgi:hypothetical protein